MNCAASIARSGWRGTYVAVLATVACCTTTVPSQRDTLEQYFRVLSRAAPTIEEFEHLFGRESTAELDTIIAVHAPALKPSDDVSADSPIVSVARARLSNRGKPSLFLACLKATRPALAVVAEVPRMTQKPVKAGDRFAVWVASTGGGDLEFLFQHGSTLIEDIRMPNGRSIYTLIPECKKVVGLDRL